MCMPNFIELAQIGKKLWRGNGASGEREAGEGEEGAGEKLILHAKCADFKQS